jgi:hypothetical protein
MPADRYAPATVELVVEALTPGRNADRDYYRRQAVAVLDALTAAGWRPPPPAPDGIHWRTGGSVGCTIYGPYGDLAGMMRTPEAAAAVVRELNARADHG